MKKCTLAASMIDLTKASGADLDRRFGYARKACEANIEDACDQPGSDAFLVEVLVKDYARAYAWASYSCDKGSSPGCISLARLLADGHGVTKDEVKSVEILKGVCALAKEISATSCTAMRGASLCGAFFEEIRRPNETSGAQESRCGY